MKTNIEKRLLSGLLSLIMVFSLVPAMGVAQEAKAAAEDTEFISMPITIRDFPADGMLFEFNQLGETGISGAVTTTFNIYSINGSNQNAASGIHVYTHGNYGWEYSSVWNLCIICDASGNIVKVIPSGTSKGDVSSNTGVYYDTMKSGYYSVWVNANVTGYSTLNSINDTNKGNYTLTYSGTTLSLKSAGSGTYHNGDTAGFSLLETTAKDKFNDLAAGTIAGTTLIQNGSWNSTTVSDVTATLNSGATQIVSGAYIRTDLVEKNLGVNGKPVYTKDAVDYIAAYLQKTLPESWQNSDGSYNLWYVMGDKLDVLENKDLATVLRAQINGNIGDYTTAKSKYEAGNLNHYTQVTSYYEAAYFLLHNTYSDSTGYGMTVDTYRTLNLVQKTANGKTFYVFNSGYDGTESEVYNRDTGVIQNTQTDTMTKVTDTTVDSDGIVRGNILPEHRFNPLNGLGYGNSGNTYAAADGTTDDGWQQTYYKNTNYNLSLEGHAQFIYYEDSDLYFTFTGDDDVYLFINGIRVLDVGAAHSISKVTIKLNDVAALCGLSDGEAYDFDFFYMERHGTAANFGIETNIRIVDPAMTTTKTGYQNGISTGYNGYVDPLVPVTYAFSLKNNGEAPIEDLTFTDDDIGVSLSKDTITLNAETTANRQYVGAIVYNADGSIKSQTDNITDDALKALLDGELAVGEEIIVYGFRYTIPTEKWTAGNGTFPNTVYTTAIGVGDNAGQKLNGIADWKVQQREYSFQDYHVYEWVGKGVTLTREELLKPLVDVVSGFDSASAAIAVSSASGATSGINVNTKAVLNSDGSITYTGTETGADTFYYKVTEGAVTAVIGVAVYSYDVADNTYVLDYGLSVELNGEDFGLRVNDTLKLADNPNAATAKVTGIQDATSNYGDFTWDDPSLKYTPDDIIDNTDSVRANIQVLEDGATELTKFTGVAMYETVTTAPASVVYYEENFPGITYVNEGDNQWAHYETVDEDGNSVAGTEQSADQDSNYGSDPNYEEDKVGTIVSGDSVGTVVDEFSFQLDTTNLDTLQSSGIDALNAYLGLGGSDSNGTVNELVVKQTAEVMYFEFVGTGFEIISRTTDEQYAVINVEVQKPNEDGTYTIVKQKPVITESKGGDLYQVPIISITDLERAEYRVVVKAAGSTDTKTRILYIDGIRIYGPLDDGSALKYYNPEEYQAEIFEIKQLIENGQMIYADASETDDDLELVTGTTLIEDVEANGVLTSIESVEEYMTIGPNNELYLDGNSATGIIAFFLTPDETTPVGARTIEIGAHRKSDSAIDDNGDVSMTYGSTAQSILDGDYAYTIASGTEMYYSIDVGNLTLDNGSYLVMIGTNGSENYGTTLVLTNLKVSGYDIHFAQTAVMAAYTAGDLMSTPIVSEPAAVYAARRPVVDEMEPIETEPAETEPVETAPIETEPFETEAAETEPVETEAAEPEVTEPEVTLTINSAALKAAKVVSGKVATLTVRTTAEAASIAVTDADGNVMEPVRTNMKTSGDTVAFTFIWTVTGSRGDALDFTVRAYDAEGRVSLNEETVTVTIK